METINPNANITQEAADSYASLSNKAIEEAQQQVETGLIFSILGLSLIGVSIWTTTLIPAIVGGVALVAGTIAATSALSDINTIEQNLNTLQRTT